MATASFSVRTDLSNEGVAVLRPVGEIDIASSPIFRKTLEVAVEERRRIVVVDLADVSFIDSSGVLVLLQAHRESLVAGYRLVVVEGPHRVQQTLGLLHLDDTLEIVPQPLNLQDIC